MAGRQGFTRRLFSSWESGVAIIFGLVTVGLAMPRLVAAVILLPGDAIVWEIRHGLPVAAEELGIAADTRRTARRLSDGKLELELGRILLRIGRTREFTGSDGSTALDEAEVVLRDGLAASPADAYAWIRLARTKALLGEPPERFAGALEMSYLAGRHEPLLYLPRLSLAFGYWDRLDDETRRMSEWQIRQAWKEMPDELFELATTHRATVIVARALRRSPDDLQAFRNRLRGM